MRDRRLNRLLVRYRDRGDTRALGELFDALSPELLRVARHVSRDAGEAEDLVQATFLTLLEHPERFDETRPVTAWTVGILTNHAKAWGRSAARRVEADRALAEPRVREERERPDAVAADTESRGLVVDALARLPELYRDVVHAHLVQRKSPAEIASERDASPVTVRVQLHRGLAQLRQLVPAGLAGGLVLALPERGLAAVRTELLTHANGIATTSQVVAATGTAATSAKLGSLLMLQRITLGALAAALLATLLQITGVLELGQRDAALIPALDGELRVITEEELAADATVDDGRRAPVLEAEEASPTAPVALASRLRVRTLWSDGTPAPGIGFQYTDFTPGSEPAFARTGDGGEALLEDLPPGTIALYGDRGGNAIANPVRVHPTADAAAESSAGVAAEFFTEVELRLPPGRDLRGRVLDAEGRPVGGAELWITTGLTRDTGLPIGRSAPDGTFLLRQLTASCFLGARAAGHAPSAPEHVQYWDERQGGEGPLELDLELGGPAARVRGAVLDPSGRPVAGARVRLGAQSEFETYGPTGAEGPPPPIEVVTDERGAFDCGGLAPGVVGVAASADGFPITALEVTVAANEETLIELRLVDGAWVRGRVESSGGAALERVTLRAHQSALEYPNPRSSFDPPYAVTEADGSFEVGPLAPGLVRLSASTGDRKATASRDLEAAAGAHYEWTPRLTGLPEITGRAIDVDGTSLARWTVVGQPQDSPGLPPRVTRTDVAGRFALTFPSEGNVRLELFAPESEEASKRSWVAARAPRAWLDDVAVGAANVRLARNPAQEPTARLIAELAGPAGAPLPKLLVTIVHAGFGDVGELELAADSGLLEIGALPAGVLSLRIETEGLATLWRNDLKVEQGATLDLGQLILAAGGELRVDVAREGGGPLEGLDARLTDGEGRTWWLRNAGDTLTHTQLPAGDYELYLHAKGCGPQRIRLALRAGERTERAVRLAPGGSLGLVFLGASDDPLGASLALSVRTANGELLLDESIEPREGGHVGHWFFAPYGELRVSARCSDGRAIETTLRFDEAWSSDAPHPLRLE